MLIRALLVTTDDALRRRLRAALERLEVLVSEGLSAGRLGERLRSDTFDLLLTTPATLPRPIERSVAELRDLPGGPEIILLSDDEQGETRARLLAAGALAVLPSGLPPESLERTLAALVGRQRDANLEQVRTGRELDSSRLRDLSSRNRLMTELLEVSAKVALADTSLLFLGETGVGKEWLGRAIHAESPRRDGPFIGVNPSALPEQLLESELFGHEKGAFTGATRARRGAFELAHGGTLFLDEIGDMPTHLQIKLLRVLQERRIQRLGSERPIAVDVRIMAATHQDLETAIESKSFRQDLYFRIGVVKLTVPPLRGRREDIRPLVETYVNRYRRLLGRLEIEGVEDEALLALEDYAWPGNVRELINVVERAVLLCESRRITKADLPEEISSGAAGRRPADDASTAESDQWMDLPLPAARAALADAFERRYLSRLLAETRGNIGAAADRAGIHPRTLYNRMQLHGLRKENFKPGSESRASAAARRSPPGSSS